ncbi:MAG: tRNA (adenosine(37)-N6)-threonylcarbamoyltransferase complex transferase subunit TsaD [Tepidisphaeraceae bacterium]|jgi:N6-L-threonylcarbamoyladenine synthase
MALILGIESTCDETGAAVVDSGRRVLSNVVASQIELHARYRGVVPEIASRAHIENIIPVVREAIESAGTSLDAIDAVAVTHRPGLIGSLLIGVTAAKTLAWALGKPLIGVDHVHAHLYSVNLNELSVACRELPVVGCRLPADDRTPNSALRTVAGDPQPTTGDLVRSADPAHWQLTTNNWQLLFPALGAVLSGGHTALYEITDFSTIRLIGTTIDDAVGEAYDKVSAILGLGYPGGPIIDKLAPSGNPAAVRFPRTLLGRESLDFSFSGLKTSVLYHVRGHKGRQRLASALSESEIADVAAAFQAACIDVLVTKFKRAARSIHAKSIIVGGGVSANRGLRAALSRFHLPVFFPPMEYCTDNAAMSAALAHLSYETGQFSPLSLDAITSSQFADA